MVNNHSDLTRLIMAKTIYAQTIGKSIKTKEAIASMIMNIAKKSKKTIDDICTNQALFTFWNPSTKSFKDLSKINMTDPEFRICSRIAGRALSNILKDITFGATKHHHISKFPTWAENKIPVFECDDLLFYKI